MKKIILLITICAICGQVKSQSWNLTGNAGTNTATNFIGTTDAKALYLKTSNKTRLAITSGGKVGVGLTVPDTRLHVANTSLGSISTGGSLQIGLSNTTNLVMDDNQIQARYNGIGSTLYLQFFGGDIDVCEGGGIANFHGGISSNNSNGYGLYATGTSFGIYGYCANNFGVVGESYYTGVRGVGNLGVEGLGETYGVYGQSSYGYGIYGYSPYFQAGHFESVSNNALWAKTSSTAAGVYAGVFEGSVYTYGVYSSSDRTLKKNIREFGDAMSIINKLKPKNYEFRNDGKYAALNLPKGNHYGFIAQELEEVLPELVAAAPHGLGQPAAKPADPKNPNKEIATTQTSDADAIPDTKAINYTELIPIMIKAMQEQQQEINLLKTQNAQMQQDLQSCCLNLFNDKADSRLSQGETDKAILEQNNPNPFNQTTIIRYDLSAKHSSGVIIIRDLSGNLVKSIAISNTGKGQVTIDANEFAQGTYTYSLAIAGGTVDTKLMVITK